jgi:hypothetical protein
MIRGTVSVQDRNRQVQNFVNIIQFTHMEIVLLRLFKRNEVRIAAYHKIFGLYKTL